MGLIRGQSPRYGFLLLLRFFAVGRILESDISNSGISETIDVSNIFVGYKYSTRILNLHLFQFRKLGIQLFYALFAEVDGQSGGFAFVHGVDDDAGAEFGVADVLSDAEACVGLRLFVVVDDFVFGRGGLARAAVAVVGGFFDGQVVQYFGWDFFDKAGDDAELGLSVQHTLLRHGDVKAFAGAGDGDVHEAAFFFEAAAFGEGVFAGEAAFFQAGEEDGVEFQAFGGVDGHQLDGFFARACLVFSGLEGGVA